MAATNDDDAARIETFADFWPYYLQEHSKATTRAWHYFGTIAATTALIYGLATQTWWLVIAALVCGYGPAWIGHFFIEKNRPATFKYPLWSLASDFRMCFYWLTGRIGSELRKYQISEQAPKTRAG